MKTLSIMLAVILLTSVLGCTMTQRESGGAATGALLGAAAGGIIGHQSGQKNSDRDATPSTST